MTFAPLASGYITRFKGANLVICRGRGVWSYCFSGSIALPPKKLPREPRDYSCSVRKELHSRCLFQLGITVADTVAVLIMEMFELVIHF